MTISDIVNKIYFLTKTNSDSFLASDMLIFINNAYERVGSLLLSVDNRWQWDDTNQTDLPIATTNLISGQYDYSLASVHLKITRVECATNSTGNKFEVLNYFDQSDEKNSLTNLSGKTGIPYRYDNIGNSILLDPKPNFNCTNGLKIFFQRGPSLYSAIEVAAGTKQPGFSSLYHDLIPLWVAYEYCYANGINTANAFMNEIVRKEDALKKDYFNKNTTDRKIMSQKKINYI